MSTRIELKNFVKRYGQTEVIHGVDLTVEPGEFAVFVGPSGCGKSTLLRMIAGLESISDGDLILDGARVNDLAASDRGIAMVFQSYALYPHMTVFKNMAFGLETMGAPKRVIEEKVLRAARVLQIEKLLQRKPKQLSGGQRQRVAIGRAITREPKIFLFDEPLSNLDAELRVQMRVEIAELHRDLGNTMIYVTHDQVEAMTMADKIVVLKDGLIQQAGAPLDLYNRPANRFVAGFIGSPRMNFLTARVVSNGEGGARLAVSGSELALGRTLAGVAPGTEVELGIRPEHLALSPDAAGAVCLPGLSVDLVESLGGQTLVYAQDIDRQRLTVALNGQSRPRGSIEAWFDPADAHVFDAAGRVI